MKKEEMVPNSCVKSIFLKNRAFLLLFLRFLLLFLRFLKRFTIFTFFGSIYDFYDFRNYILVEALSNTLTDQMQHPVTKNKVYS
jgi:hypothetical protein